MLVSREQYGCSRCRDFGWVEGRGGVHDLARCSSCCDWTPEKRSSEKTSAYLRMDPPPKLRVSDLSMSERAYFEQEKAAGHHELAILRWLEGRRYEPSKDATLEKEALRVSFASGGAISVDEALEWNGALPSMVRMALAGSAPIDLNDRDFASVENFLEAERLRSSGAPRHDHTPGEGQRTVEAVCRLLTPPDAKSERSAKTADLFEDIEP